VCHIPNAQGKNLLKGMTHETLGVYRYILKGMEFMAPLAFVSRSKVHERHDPWHPWSR